MNAFVAGPGERFGDPLDEVDPDERLLHDLQVSLTAVTAGFEARGHEVARAQDENRILRGALRKLGVNVETLLGRSQPAALDVPF